MTGGQGGSTAVLNPDPWQIVTPATYSNRAVPKARTADDRPVALGNQHRGVISAAASLPQHIVNYLLNWANNLRETRPLSKDQGPLQEGRLLQPKPLLHYKERNDSFSALVKHLEKLKKTGKDVDIQSLSTLKNEDWMLEDLSPRTASRIKRFRAHIQDVPPSVLAENLARQSSPEARPEETSPEIKTEGDNEPFNWAAFPSKQIEQGMEQIRLNTAQVLHVPTWTFIKAGGEGDHKIIVEVVRDMENAETINHRQQTYNFDLEKRFPIRDPKNPEHVHPLYADPNDPTRVAKGVSLKDVQFYKTASLPVSEENLWRLAQKDGTTYRTKTLYIDALKQSVKAEVQATIDGRDPPSTQSLEIRPIEHKDQCDSPEEYQATQHQLGAFLKDYAKERQPTLRNARMACMFAGSRLETDEETILYLARTGTEFGTEMLHDYAAKRNIYGKKDEITWAPHGGGNMAQFFNASLKKGILKDKDFLVCDEKGATAMLLPITLTLTDKDGQEREESMLGIVITKTIADGKQPKLNYGERYKIPCKKDEPVAMPVETESSGTTNSATPGASRIA